MQDIVEDILIGIEAGATINEMMAKYPKVFPPLYVNFVRVGEESGSLDTALLHARDYMESSMRLRKQIRGILLPKISLFVFILAVMIIALLFGTPLIQNVYDMFGVDKQLPAATQFAIRMSEAIVEYWYVAVACVLGIIGVISFVLLLLFANKSKAENAEEISLSPFSYTSCLPIYLFCGVFAVSLEGSTTIFIWIFIILAVYLVLKVIQYRKIKLSPKVLILPVIIIIIAFILGSFFGDLQGDNIILV